MSTLAIVVPAITSFLAFAGCAYYLLAIWSARAFLKQRRVPEPENWPSISILKPIKGLDPEMYAGLASHCRQDYPGKYEIIFAVRNLNDPAVAGIERLRVEYPARTIRVVECPQVLGTNGKISNLVQALPHAAFDLILINDSDIFVGPRYLRRIASAFPGGKSGARVGMVTALYRGRSRKTVSSKIEALAISTDFAPGVLAARFLDRGLRFGLGSTLAVSRDALEAIGGVTPLVDQLADDYELGARIHQAGYEIVLSDEVVETSVPEYRIRDFVAHQLRWMRTIRDSRKAGYMGMIFTFGLPWALLNVAASAGGIESWALLAVVAMGRVCVALLIGASLLRDEQVLPNLWLVPVRDLAALGLWAWSFAADTIAWRGEQFHLRRGKLERVPGR